MAYYQPAPGLLNSMDPIFIQPAGLFSEDADNSNPLTSGYQSPPPSFFATDWMDEYCCHIELLPSNISRDLDSKELFDMQGVSKVSNGPELQKLSPISDSCFLMGSEGHMVKTEDELTGALSFSGGDIEKSLNNGSQSPNTTFAASVVEMKQNSFSSFSDQTHGRLPAESTKADTVTNYESSPAATAGSSTINTINTPSPRFQKSSKPFFSSLPSSHTNSRRNSSASASSTDPATAISHKKAAHNAIEKRYRAKMNSKFLALENAMSDPFTTQLVSNKKSESYSHCHTEDLATAGGVKRGKYQQQHNKSEILTNALSSLKELEDDNSKLNNEILALKKNILARNNGTRRLQPCL